MKIGDVFSGRDLEEIREATRAAESRTSGEIVAVVVESCDSYEGALWRSAAIGSMAASIATAAVFLAVETWGGPDWWWLALPAVAGAAAGYLLPVGVPALHRAIVGRDILEMRVERRAAQAFVDEEVFATRDRNGVLLFVGLFEHRVEVLRDRAAHEAVPADSWDDLAERLAGEIRRGHAAKGLVRAIEDTGRLLELHGFTRRDDDVDELGNNLRLFDE